MRDVLDLAVGFVTTWWRFGLVLLVVSLSAFVLGRCQGERAGADRVKRQVAEANLSAAQKGAAANETAAAERRADDTSSAALERSLANAAKDLPDARPSEHRVRLNCQRMRNAGVDVAAIPECGGLAAGGQTSPGR